jgi:RNA polymerase sigma factor (sigma-70 family)
VPSPDNEKIPVADDADFAERMARLRAGDSDAAADLFHRFAGRLAALAARRLGPFAKGKLDPEDVIQSVFKSFFRRQADGRLSPEGWGGLWVLLTRITLHKCGHKLTYLRAARRDVRRESALPAPDLSDPSWQAVASDPTPSQAAILTETIEQIAGEFEEYHRDIFRLALEGNTVAEIAASVKVTERTVQRVLKRVRERLEALASG